MSQPRDIVDDQQRPVSLQKLLGRGGEGAVYEILGDSTKAAKIYLPDKAAKRRDKVLAMTKAGLQKSARNVAFPIKPLFHRKGTFAGFTMEKVGGRKPIHELYSPSSRRTKFATADFRFLVRTALNISNAVAAVHASGCVIGDVNQSGFLISEDARATLIDADSFQFGLGSDLYRCEVLTEDYTAPELQGRRSKQPLNPNHDAFGLAVMIFMLLFMGRHPFIGDFRQTGSLPYETAISEFRFAFSKDRARTEMEPPPHVPGLADLPDELADAFERAFGPSGAAARPSAADWVALLKRAEAELVACRSSPAHHYFRSAQACPWCRMERGFPGFIAFASPILINSTAPADLGQLIAAIRAVPDPGVAPPLDTLMPAVQASPPRRPMLPAMAGYIAATLGAIISVRLLTTQTIQPLLALGGLAGCACVALRPPFSSKPAGQRSNMLRNAFQLHEENYRAIASNRGFVDIKQKADGEIRELGELGGREAKQIAALSQQQRNSQLHRHLDQFQIASAKIKGLGSAKTATLRSYGIETAADIAKARIEAISGFGPATSALLLTWRQTLEKNFRYDPNQQVDPAEIARVRTEIAEERSRVEAALRSRLMELRAKGAELTQSRATLVGHAASVWQDLRQAEAEERAASPPLDFAARTAIFGALVALAFLMPNTKVQDPNTKVQDRVATQTTPPSIQAPAQPDAPRPPPVTGAPSSVQTGSATIPTELLTRLRTPSFARP
jgi:DNA-binding helix-hairpin-helix protein with protein kinase domain